MKFFIGLVFLVGIGSVQSAHAYSNGNDLREWCNAALDKQSQTGARSGLCVGFLDAYRQLATMLPETKLLCLPAGVGQEGFIRVVVKYLDQHPEKLQLPAAQLVYDAAGEAFPCSAGPK